MSSRSPGRTVRRVVAALTLLLVLLVVRPLPALADGGLQVVAVRPTPQGVTAVVGLDPAPLVPLAGDAATVTTVPAPSGVSPAPKGQRIATTVSPVVDLTRGTPLALVVDGSAAGGDARAQALSGSTGMLLRLPSQTPVSVVADGSPPRLLTRDGARPADAITALTGLSTSPGGTPGPTSTAAALELAVQHLPQSFGGNRVVVLTTSAAPPTGDDAKRLVDSLTRAGVVLGVVGTGSAGTSWKDIAAATGGTAVAAVPADTSAAYDSLLSSLQGRYVVRFVPPAGTGKVSLAVTSAGQRYQTDLTIPGAAPTPGATPTPGTAPAKASESSSLTAWIIAGLVVLAGLVLVMLLLLRRRRASRRDAAQQAGADDDQAARKVDPVYDATLLPGVRVFDVSDPEQPTEIPDPLPASAGAPEPVAQEAVAQQPEPVAQEPELEPLAPEPVVQEQEPEPLAPEPVVQEPEPVAQEPEPVAPEPEPVAQEPEPVAPEPAAQEPDPVAPDAVAPEPVTASEPSTPAPTPTEYVGRHRTPVGAVDEDEEDEDEDDAEAGGSEPDSPGPGAHRERRGGAGSFREVS